MDRRADYFVASKPRFIGASMDIDSLAAEAYGAAEAAHIAHWQNEPTRFLRAISTVGEKVVSIGKIARDLSGEVDRAPVVDPAQLAFWTRGDGAVVGPDGVAA